MALIQTRNMRQNVNPAAPKEAGALFFATFTIDLASAANNNGVAGMLAADVVEFGCLPAGCKIAYAHMNSVGIDATATIDIGFLSGEYGVVDNARVMNATAEIFNDATRNQSNIADPLALQLLAASNVDRGIGAKVSADETPNAGESITLTIAYYAA
jgi:hypothetical protein